MTRPVLRTLEAYNELRSRGRTFTKRRPEDAYKPMGIACPRCGAEIRANLLIRHESVPPVNSAWCSAGCGWVGKVVA